MYFILWWKIWILGSHYSIWCVYVNTCYISLFEFNYILYALKFKFCILCETEWHTTLPWSWCENTITLVGPQRYWMWQRAHCVSSSCPELCIRERELEAQGYCIEVVAKRKTMIVWVLHHPTAGMCPGCGWHLRLDQSDPSPTPGRCWWSPGNSSEPAESATSHHSYSETMREKKRASWAHVHVCVWEREKVKERWKEHFKQGNTVQQDLMFSTQCSSCALWVTALRRALWQRYTETGSGDEHHCQPDPFPQHTKTKPGTAFVERAAGWQMGWHQTWAGWD